MENIAGKRYGFLTAIKFSHYKPTRSKKIIYWQYKCDCGNIITRAKGDVTKGSISSCGCKTKQILSFAKQTHGLSSTSLYEIYKLMIRRCLSPINNSYKNYGGRGIKVCEEWKNDFMAFYKWAMANGYREDLTIDRINVNGDYEPDNCRWATKQEQSNNKRNNHIVTYKGEKHSLADWCRILKLNYYTIRGRLNNYHYTPEQAFEFKIGERRKCMQKANFNKQP